MNRNKTIEKLESQLEIALPDKLAAVRKIAEAQLDKVRLLIAEPDLLQFATDENGILEGAVSIKKLKAAIGEGE